MSVTFKDVAELAGVSTQTVSRVTNGATNVAEETRRKVNAAIEQLGYVPNRGAQLLGRAKPMVIGLITPEFGLHGVSLIANGIRKQAKALGYGISFSVVVEPDVSSINEAIRDLKAQKVESIIVNVQLSKEQAELFSEQYADIHFVFIDLPDNTRADTVSAANYEGACQAARLMLQQQRSSLLLISGPSDSTASQLRLKGWRDTLAEGNANVAAQYEGNWQAESGYLQTRTALAKGISFDGVLVASDQMALGVLHALDEMGIKAPAQAAVIGFDDTGESAFFSPPLTTIRQDFQAIGERAVELALSEGRDSEGRHESIPTQLVERQSTEIKQQTSYDKQEIQVLLNAISEMLPDKF